MENLQNLRVTIDDATGVALVQLDRPAKRNAFSQVMIDEIVSILAVLDSLDPVRAVVLTGSPDGPFCAGMDIKELAQISTAEAHRRAFLKDLTDAFARFSKPIIAAVVGVAVSVLCGSRETKKEAADNFARWVLQVGGGFEIALACDIIYAAEDALFGLPEIKIGTIPGAGGTQQLTRALGKHKAMEFILTGEPATGREFERLGLVNRTFARHEVLTEAKKLAEKIAAMSGPVARLAKQAVLISEDSHLTSGMAAEKTLYYSTFSFKDFEEGQAAFLEKRSPKFTHA